MSNVLYEPFDIETHKKNFINYFEVVIREDGTVEYAVPSHQEKLITLACEKQGVTRDELNNMCPVAYYFDFMTWLSMQSGAIAVWQELICGEVNELQVNVLQDLKNAGLYTGNIPKTSNEGET